jgi:hypothetical protein
VHPNLYSHLETDLRMAAKDLEQVALPAASQRLANALATLAKLQAAEGTITLAMLNAGYDATRLACGTPQFASSGFVLGSSAAIYAAMRGAVSTVSPVAVTFTLQEG